MGCEIASSRSSPAAVASSVIRGPRTNRPWLSRVSTRCRSSATASRCAVGLARPVAATSWASEAGPASRAFKTATVLSRTPTPLELSMVRYCRLVVRDATSRGPRCCAAGLPRPGRQPAARCREKGTPMGRTLAQKIWDSHVVRSADGEPDLLYIDLHLVHEVTSPQAFDGLRLAGRWVRRPDLTIAI